MLKETTKKIAIVLAVLTIALIFAPFGQAKAEEELPLKYIFLFIGDGMGYSQINLAQMMEGNEKKGETAIRELSFSKFPYTGIVNTHDKTSLIPDSASTASAMSTGNKIYSGVICKDTDLMKSFKTIAQQYKEAGRKVGILSSVTLNHATPAAFYASVDSRKEYYEIGKQMADSNFDYFAGGSLGQRTGKDGKSKDLYQILKDKGYKITETRKDFENIKKGEKVYAVSERLQDSGAMPYMVDQKKGDMTLHEMVKKGIEVLDNEKGFFMMAEGGKIDWACHANDARAAYGDVLDLELAVNEAIKFYNKHPKETLILVTADHETGGMSLGYYLTHYNTNLEILRGQKISQVEFDNKITALGEKVKFEQIKKIITENTALKFSGKEDDKFVLNEREINLIKQSIEAYNKGEKVEMDDEYTLKYGGYNPIAITITKLIANKSGITFGTNDHTAVPIPVYAIGKHAELFTGTFHDTKIHEKMLAK